jgi:hypothetical protein
MISIVFSLLANQSSNDHREQVEAAHSKDGRYVNTVVKIRKKRSFYRYSLLIGQGQRTEAGQHFHGSLLTINDGFHFPSSSAPGAIMMTTDPVRRPVST